jgi:hypothetical protein
LYKDSVYADSLVNLGMIDSGIQVIGNKNRDFPMTIAADG